MRFTLLVPGWIGVPVTRWMFLGFIQRGTPTSQMLRLLSHQFVDALADQFCENHIT